MSAYFDGSQDTICAPSTPPGFGGVSVIRVSGPSSLSIVSKLFCFPRTPQSHHVYFGDFVYENKSIDEVLVTYFAKGRSYTGDETIEISCHGSPIVVEEILQALIRSGCRAADRGEFTFRAFMNGNIDLVQAESVLSLIESQTQKAHTAALRQLKGDLSIQLKKIQENLKQSLAHLEANIDFSLENLETMSSDEILQKLKSSHESTQALVKSYTIGKIVSNSLKVVLLGEPNVGKSSLFNSLINQDKAIVTPIAGTTRDILESSVVFNGYKVQFVDTAGIHETQDAIEQLGITKTKKELEDADLILCILDLSLKSAFDFGLLKGYAHKTIFVGNKDDIKQTSYSDFLNENLPKNKYIEVSALQKESLSKIWSLIDEKLKESFVDTSVVVLKQRQFELLKSLENNLEKSISALSQDYSPEFVALELRSALENTYEILGERFDDQVLVKVFQEFCIGK
jgi:tRNA modification GTPase